MLLDRPASISEVLDSSFRVYGASFRFAVPVMFVAQLGTVIAGWVAQYGVLFMFGDPALGVTFWNERTVALVLLAIAVYLIGLLWYLSGFAATTYYQGMIGRGAPVAAASAISTGGRRGIWILLASFVWLVLLVLLLLPVAALIGLLIYLEVGFLIGLAVGGLLGSILLLPLLYASLPATLWAYPIVLRGEGPIQAIKSLFGLIRGQWWRSLLIVSVPAIILTAVVGTLVMLLVAAFLIGAAATQGSAPDLSGVSVWTMLLDLLVALAVALGLPLFTATCVALYHDLLLRRRGLDLAERIAKA